MSIPHMCPQSLPSFLNYYNSPCKFCFWKVGSLTDTNIICYLLSLLSPSSNFCTFCCLEHPSPDIHVVHSLSLAVLCRTTTLVWKCFKPSNIKYTCTNDSLSYLLYFPLFLLFSVYYFLYLFQLECKIQEIRDFLFGSIFIFFLVSFVLFCLLHN